MRAFARWRVRVWTERENWSRLAMLAAISRGDRAAEMKFADVVTRALIKRRAWRKRAVR